MNNGTTAINDLSVRAALADGHIQCAAKDTDYPVFKFVNYGIRLEPLPAGQSERTLEVFALHAKDITLQSVCQRLIDSGETYDALLLRYYSHLPGCLVCNAPVSLSERWDIFWVKLKLWLRKHLGL